MKIPCRLRKPQSRRIVASVLRRIEQHFQTDYARLLTRVRVIRPLPLRKFRDGTRGEWIAKTVAQIHADDDFFSLPIELQRDWDEWATGVIELPEAGQIPDWQLTVTTAHELGHACTQSADISRRCAPDPEWGSEAAADWYVYRWGFGRLSARDQKERRFTHHGATPGGWIEISGEQFEMTRSFVYRLIGPADRRCRWREK